MVKPEKKTYGRPGTPVAPKIDEHPGRAVWQDANACGDFIQFNPYNGNAPSNRQM